MYFLSQVRLSCAIWATGEDKTPFSYIAFGGGRHKCLGNSFAILQIKTILAILLQRYEFGLTDDPIEPDFQALVIGPKLLRVSPISVFSNKRPPLMMEQVRAQNGLTKRAKPTERSKCRYVDFDLCQGTGHAKSRRRGIRGR